MFFLVLLNFLRLYHRGSCQLALELVETGQTSVSPVRLQVERNQTRSIELVRELTYHVACLDTSDRRGRFDNQEIDVWYRINEGATSVVQKYHDRSSFPETAVPAVYASTAANQLANEWTLVLQKMQPEFFGVYRCVGLEEGQSVSLDISEATLSVIAGIPERHLKAGATLTDTSLVAFVSPALLSFPSIRWSYNGNTSFPPRVLVIENNELILRSPISGDMRGNYTIKAQLGDVVKSATFLVTVDAPPQALLWPTFLSNDYKIALINGSKVSVSCSDESGFPLPTVTWSRNQADLIQDGGRVWMSTMRSGTAILSNLTFDPIMPSDVGTYTCVSQNRIASSQGFFQIIQVHEFIITPHLERTFWFEGETVHMQARLANYDYNGSVEAPQWTWKKDGTPLIPSTNFISREFLNGSSVLVIEADIHGGLEASGSYSLEIISDHVGVYTVNFDPITVIGVQVESWLSEPTLYFGLELNVTCQVTLSSDEVALQADFFNVSWVKKSIGSPFASVSRTTVTTSIENNSSSGLVVVTYQRVMSFSPLRAGDRGTYVCRVTSNLTKAIVEHTLTLPIDSTSFQLRLIGAGNCLDWVDSDRDRKVLLVKEQIILAINHYCPLCDFSPRLLVLPMFQCFPASPQAVTFRAQLLGTETHSAADIIKSIQMWFEQRPSITFDTLVIAVDASCPIEISSPGDPECGGVTGEGATAEVSVMMIVIVSVVLGTLLVVLVIMATIALILSVRKGRKRAVYDSPKNNGGAGAVSAVNPSVVTSNQAKEEGLAVDNNGDGWLSEHEYEEIDQYREPEVDNMKIQIALHKCDEPTITENLEYDYAAI